MRKLFSFVLAMLFVLTPVSVEAYVPASDDVYARYNVFTAKDADPTNKLSCGPYDYVCGDDLYLCEDNELGLDAGIYYITEIEYDASHNRRFEIAITRDGEAAGRIQEGETSPVTPVIGGHRFIFEMTPTSVHVDLTTTKAQETAIEHYEALAEYLQTVFETAYGDMDVTAEFLGYEIVGHALLAEYVYPEDSSEYARAAITDCGVKPADDNGQQIVDIVTRMFSVMDSVENVIDDDSIAVDSIFYALLKSIPLK